MGKIGVMMSAESADEAISSHFGKAEWLMITDTGNPTPVFVKNEMLSGKSAVEIAHREGCSDLIFTEIGNGAFGHLKAAGIRGWVAPEHITGSHALNMFDKSILQPASTSTKQGGGAGCCCASGTGPQASTCCRG